MLIAKGESELRLLPVMSNRHGLIAGATGTGKTVTLQVMAQAFSEIGVPVFLADVKGDLAGLCEAGDPANKRVCERIQAMGLSGFTFAGAPVRFWDVLGEQGHPMRSTVSEMGPLLLSRLLALNETQSGVLSIVFRLADESGLLLLDLKDLRAMVRFVGENAKSIKTQYGNVTPASIGAIQRALLALEEQGGEHLFGEPALALADLMQVDEQGKGIVNILSADKLLHSPLVYASFLLWLLSELFQEMPEVGDVERPKLVFFFDEAHLLFDDAPKVLVDRIEQVVRLIRSKGIGVYFVTQNPLDVPEMVLGQLGNRVQHALRAFTPRDQKAVRAAAETFRANPSLNIVAAISELGVGEGLISFLDERGMPGIVNRAMIMPPRSRIGPITAKERGARIVSSPLFGKYDHPIDRDSAYELLKARAEHAAAVADAEEREESLEQYKERMRRERAALEAALDRELERLSRTTSRRRTGSRSSRRTDTAFEAMAKSAARSAGTSIGRSLSRGILGGLFGKKSRRR
jgi:DNA helicase HerA-like ATPase